MDGPRNQERQGDRGVLLIHHVNKGGAVRGSTAIEGATPFVMLLEPIEQPGQNERQVRLSMDWKLAPIEPMILAYRAGRFERRGTEAEVLAETLRARILVVIEARPGCRTKDIARAVRTREEDVRDELSALRTEGRIEVRETQREGTRGPAPKGWFLAGQADAGTSKPAPRVAICARLTMPGR